MVGKKHDDLFAFDDFYFDESKDFVNLDDSDSSQNNDGNEPDDYNILDTLREIQDLGVDSPEEIFFCDKFSNIRWIEDLYSLDTILDFGVRDLRDVLAIYETLVTLGIHNDRSKHTDQIIYQAFGAHSTLIAHSDYTDVAADNNLDFLVFLHNLPNQNNAGSLKAIRIIDEYGNAYCLKDLYNPYILYTLGVCDTLTVRAIYDALVALGIRNEYSAHNDNRDHNQHDSLSKNDLVICNSFSMRYSASVSKSSKRYGARNGYYNNLRFYFYSPALKKQIGEDWRTTYALTKKEIKPTKGKPAPQRPKQAVIQNALAELFHKNAGIPVKQEKKTQSGIKTIELDTDELAVFWLTRFNDFYGAYEDDSKNLELHNIFAKLCTSIGGYNLKGLCTSNTKELEKKCGELMSGIKKALNANKSTSNTAEKTRVIRHAISKYLEAHEVDPSQVNEYLMRMSIPRKTVLQKIADNLRPQSMPIDRYSEIYDKLKNDDSGMSKGLQLMLFLGLTSEEVCGLNMGDFQKLNHYYGAFQLCIARRYQKNGRKYEIIYDEYEEFFRCVPVPFPMYKLFSEKVEQGQKNEPLLTENGQRIRPDKLIDALKALLNTEKNMVSVLVDGKSEEIDIAFRATSYRASCRYYWHYYAGLTEGEISYLLAMRAPDTLSGHYIDFFNETEQFRMNKQLEHGLALLLRNEMPSPSRLGALSKRITELSGTKDTRVDMNLIITERVKLSLSSWRGLHITKEEDQ